MSPEPEPKEGDTPLLIIKPENSQHVDLLGAKLLQYAQHFGTGDRRSRTPELNVNTRRGYARVLITELLKEGQVNPDITFHNLSEKHGDLFDAEKFTQATNLVIRYSEDKEYLQRQVDRVRNKSSQ